jgi:pimeloyl-ACP methyl ester carboxylesterase
MSLPSTFGAPSAAEDAATLHLPRLLCLHGGGTNARIFRTQCRVLRARLASHFRLVFIDAPFFLDRPGPDVVSVYADWGPFRSWLSPDTPAEQVARRIEDVLEAGKRSDDDSGATGEWVGVLGFSQGAKLAASLLLRDQLRMDQAGGHGEGLRDSFRFAVVLAGRAPLIDLSTSAETESGSTEEKPVSMSRLVLPGSHASVPDGVILRLPTIHIHGTRDIGIAFHRELLENCCEKGTTKLIEWNGDHRLPIKSDDVTPVVESILAVARKTGVL